MKVNYERMKYGMKRIICLFTVFALSFCLFAACAPEIPSGSSDVPSSETEKTGIDLLLDGAPEDIVATVKEYSEKHCTTDSYEGFVKALTYLLKHNRFDVLAELQEKTNMKFDYSKIGKDVHIFEASYVCSEKGDYYAVYIITYEVSKSKINGISTGERRYITVDVENNDGEYRYSFMPGKQNITSVLRRAGWDKLFANFVIVFNNEGYPKLSEEYERLELFMANAVTLLGMDPTVESYNALMEKYFGLKNYYSAAGKNEDELPLIKDVYDNVMSFFEGEYLWQRLWKINAGITASRASSDYANIEVSTVDDDFALHITGTKLYDFRKDGEGYILDNPFVDEDPYFEKLIKELPEDIAVAIDSYARKGFTEKAPEEAAKALVYLLNNNRFDIMGEMFADRQYIKYDYSLMQDKVTVSDASYTLVSEIDDYYYTYLIEYTIADTMLDDFAPGKHVITASTEKTYHCLDDGEYTTAFQSGDQQITDVLKADGWDKVFNVIYYYYVYYYANEKQTFDKVDPEFLGYYITTLAWCLGLEDGTVSGYNEAVKRCYGIEGFLTDAGKDEDGNILATDIYGRTLTLGITTEDIYRPLYRWEAGISESGADGDGAYIRVATVDDVFALHVIGAKTFSFALKDGHYYLKSVE